MSPARLAWFFAALLIADAAAAPPLPSGLDQAARKYLESGAESDRAALSRIVEAAVPKVEPYARLALGVADHYAERYEEAAAELAVARGTLLGDHAAFFEGRSLAKADQHEQAARALTGFSTAYPSSRLANQASQIRAESLIRAERLDQARALLEDQAELFSPPVRHYLLGRVLELRGERQAAVVSYRKAYYFYPFSDQADEAEKQLDGLRKQLGGAYPEAPPKWRLARADALFSGGAYGRAADEFALAYPGLSGTDQQRAKVRHAAADYHRLHTTKAYQFLRSIEVSDANLAAERLYYLGECARRNGLIKEFEARAEELGRRYPQSPWREEALFSLGNYYLLQNDAQRSRTYYERAARDFPKGKHAPSAHWKVCWRAYLDRDPRARSLMQEHVRLYPDSGQASAALYWIARLDEKAGRPGDAKPLYAEIVEHFPNYYYASEASRALERLAAVESAGQPDLHSRLPLPRRVDNTPREATARLLERGRTLYALGLDELAERELQTGDYRLSDAHLVGLELARQAAERGDYFRGLRHMKRYGFGYLRFDPESMPREFWERLYPIPFEDRLEARATPHDLDPYLVAGLIRQESEYNPQAVSHAGAIGLMQIMPGTGRELFRRLGIGGYSTRRLRDPDISLRLGTFHLKEVIEQFEGHLELALAAYNAGGHRADEWITWGKFEEPAEFIETIPFTETRGYVQSVLRNRDMYRWLYERDTRASAERPSDTGRD